MQSTTILTLGLSHQTAPVELREQINDSLASIAPHLNELSAVHELLVLSTCNRVEWYAAIGPSATCPRTDLLNLMAKVSGLPLSDFVDHSYAFSDREAIKHLFRVAAGLESQVLGEPQILGQVSNAYRSAVDARTIGSVLDALFKAAIRTSKRARQDTAISRNPASVSSVSIALIQRALGDFQNKHAVVLGAGQMGRLAIHSLHKRGCPQISVVNRTAANAESVISKYNGQGYGLSQLQKVVADADALITVAQTPTPIVYADVISKRQRPLIIVDAAVPRNVDAAVGDIPDVNLFDMDDLHDIRDENLAARQSEVPKVEAIIDEEMDLFSAQVCELMMRPLIVDMRRKAEAYREEELSRVLRELGHGLDPKMATQLQNFSHSLVNKLLHEPTVRLKAKASAREAGLYAATVRDLFGLAETLT